jgi:hypothetical protein
MSQFRFFSLAVALASGGALIACSTPPAMTVATPSGSMAAPDHVAQMDAQVKTMHEMHEKMMSAKTPEERSKLMPEHMKVMQDSMEMMNGMGDMKGMKGMPGMSAEMDTHHQMMDKRTEMMQAMMTMMKDRMPVAPAK